MKSAIHTRSVFQQLVFAQCWEDPELDIEALGITPRDRVLVVTSGGCNALNLLTEGPRELVAIDMNPAQSWLLELKLAGIRALPHEEYLGLLGVSFVEGDRVQAPPALEIYEKVRPLLSAAAQQFWDERKPSIASGVLWCGRYESYLGLFRRLLQAVQGKGKVRELMRQPLALQKDFYREQWDTLAWRLLFRVFFSRYVLGKRGLDPMFFRHVQDVPSFGERWRQSVEHALTRLPTRSNYFLAQIGLGAYLNRDNVPRYLHAAYFERLKHYAGRVRIVTDELEGFLASCEADSIDKFALSNVFEWVDEKAYEQLLIRLWRVGSPRARLSYRNLLVYRERPQIVAGAIRSHQTRARQLLKGDRSFVYSNFVIEEIVKEPLPPWEVAQPQAVAAPAGAY